ncbi:MAG TPA: hypothetical protein VGO55_09870 [Allosphingosinicella sp.]|nr:hypothetical protein [Allosphingosinicella sp.]
MALHIRYFCGLFLPLLIACNRVGNTQDTANSDEINAQQARHDGEVRGGRLETLADELNAQAAREGGARGRALKAEAGRDSNTALSVYETGEARAQAIERNIGAERDAAGNR